MKVRTASGETETVTSPEAYSDQVAKLFADALLERDRHSPGGVYPSPEVLVERLAGLVMAEEGQTNRMAEALSPFWSAAKVASELRTSEGREPTRQALADRRKNGSLLGLVTSDNKTVYPVAQFHRVNGRVEVRPGVKAMLSVLRRADPWSVAQLILSNAPVEELGGRSAFEVIVSGTDQERLVAYADLVRREWDVPR